MNTKSILSIIGCAALASAGLSQAATITSVGTQENGGTFAVANWSNPGVTKTYDIGGTEKYGTAGYYQLLPNTGAGFIEGAAGGNDLGITLVGPLPGGQSTTLYSTPSFLTGNPLGGAGTYVNFGGYSIYRMPNGTDLRQQGALSLNLPAGGTNPAGAGAWGNAISFTLNTTVSFRIGLAVDSVGSPTYAPNYVSIYNASTGSIFSSALTRDGVPDMALFDISGVNGDSFAVALWQNSPNTGPAALSLVTFDVIPEPATLWLLSAGLCTVIFLRRRRMA
jgi:hypothetical protein